MIQRLLIIITLLAVLCGTAVPAVSAAGSLPPSQEDPAAARQLFSSIALLRYYSASLDFMIQQDQSGSDTNLSKVPFANVPSALNQPTTGFGSSGTSFTASLVALFGLWSQENQYVQQYRLQDAAGLYDEIQIGLPAARAELAQLSATVMDTGVYLKINSLALQNQLVVTYNEILAKIQQLNGMLNLLSIPLLPNQLTQIIKNLTPSSISNLTPDQLAGVLKSLTPEQIATGTINLTPGQLANLTPDQLAGILKSLTPAQLQEILGSLTPAQLNDLLNSLTPEQIAALLQQTQLTLLIDPTAAFVGDEIAFQGDLTAQGRPLAGREITLLYNNSVLLTAQTGGQGHYSGTFQLPYDYVHTATVQTIFYPAGSDAGTYLAAVSPAVQITVMFYEGQLELQTSTPAYPGKDVTLTGTYNYGTAPVPAERTADIYLDSTLLGGYATAPDFSRIFTLDGQLPLGKHMITVSAPADGRYAPVLGSCVLDVTLAMTVLDLNLPKLGFIPGTLTLNGRAYSAAGPLNNAAVTFTLNNKTVQVNTAADGTFTAKIGMGMELSLLGSQGLTAQVRPQEPWNAPLDTDKSIFIINYVTIFIIFAVLVFLAVYLPRRFKKLFGVTPARKPAAPVVVPAPAPVYRINEDAGLQAADAKDKQEEKANPILYWYRVALRFVQNLTKTIIKPQQTLREYARDTGKVLGPAAKYFAELTLIFEKHLYGRRQKAAETEIERSKRLAENLKESSK